VLSRFIATTDLRFLFLVLILLSFGLTMLYSASSVLATDLYQDSLYFLKRQALFALAGMAIMTWIACSSSRGWLSLSFYFLLMSLALVLLTYIPSFAVETKGAARWIRVFGFQFQPVELLKISWIVFLSHWLPNRHRGAGIPDLFRRRISVLALWFVSVAAVLYQPDFGNAFVLCAISVGMLFFAGYPLKILVGLFLAGGASAVFFVLQEDYRRRRLLAFLDPWSDPQNTSYQIIQSFTAFHSGGWWGKGLGNSQEKLYFLPEVHTDFIGSIVAEELGFLGFALLLVSFFCLCQRAMGVATRAARSETYLLASGVSLLFMLQILFNLFVILGLVPTKGIPLPFLSHGGSSLLASFAMAGFILLVAKESRHFDAH
jgi:cell division protein FtsW